VVVARVTNPFYPQLLDALSDAIAARGKLMSLWIAEEEAGELAALEAIRRGTVDGVLYTTATRESRSLRVALQRHAPVVLVSRTLERVRCDKVSSDNRGGAAVAARCLLQDGRARIGLIGGPPETSTAREREAGFRAALAAAGRPLEDGLCVRGEFTHAEGRAAMLALLRRRRRPDAVFCVNDVVAFGALDGARAWGVAVPDDLWVVGFDNIEMAGWDCFSLTTVRQPLGLIAQTAAEHLLQRIDGTGTAPAAFRHTRAPADLVVRRSAGAVEAPVKGMPVG
jgi:LacI family transcriptional regulator